MRCKHPHGEQLVEDNDGVKRYRCGSCGAALREYDRWQYALWVVVVRDDVNERFHVPWWMGSVGELYDVRRNTATFAIIPLGTVIDIVLKAWRWAKYRVPSVYHHELEMAYRRARVDTHREAAAEASKRWQTHHEAEVTELKTVLVDQEELIRELRDEIKELRG